MTAIAMSTARMTRAKRTARTMTAVLLPPPELSSPVIGIFTTTTLLRCSTLSSVAWNLWFRLNDLDTLSDRIVAQ